MNRPFIFEEVVSPEALKRFRGKWNLTQADLADHLCISEQSLYYWENGKRKMPPYLTLALECLARRWTP
jgi:DNA-binding XRE family transcriptional regulator